jgi:hypothetical protein
LKTLKTLNISPSLYSIVDDPYLSLAPQLEEFAGKNILESLTFYISVELDSSFCNTDRADWGKLDSVLSKGGAFPFLRRVEITVVLWDDVVNVWLEKHLWDIGMNHFPLLRDCDGLTFLFEVRTLSCLGA